MSKALKQTLRHEAVLDKKEAAIAESSQLSRRKVPAHPKFAMSLQGQVALVTGGARGIGLAIVTALLQEGANVVLCDISASGEATAKQLEVKFGGKRTIFVQADVRDEAQFEAAFTKAKSHFKKLDILVNNAGLVNERLWTMEVDVNLNGVIRGTLLAWKHMGKNEGGSGGTVVNIASTCGVMSIPVMPIYTATKYGVIGFSRSCGEPYNVDRTGVKVIAVCPGQTETPIFIHDITLLTPDFTEEFNKVKEEFPTQKADNVAKAVVHVLKNGSSGSVWVSEDDKPAYQLDFPEYSTMRRAQ